MLTVRRIGARVHW